MKPAPQGWGNPTRLEPMAPVVPPREEAAELAELIGRQLGNYVIERPLARGGMSVVYIAKHPALGREVAVKLLSSEYRHDVDLNRRFLQEARVTAGFHHPHIVQIYDLGELEGRAYYTMEYLAGNDLASLMARRQRFPPHELAAYFAQIASALEVAHREGIVHRDLKPANIFVVSEEPLHIKLMDFGIAKVRESRPGGGTRRGEVLGTPAYMAPEQALGNVDHISVATDVYALGIIAYEMLTGQLPFMADSDLLLLTMHIRDAPPPVREIAPHVPAAVAELVERCLAKDPWERPQSVTELSLALEAALELDDEPPLPEPEPPKVAAPAGPIVVSPRSVARPQPKPLEPIVASPAPASAPEPVVPSGAAARPGHIVVPVPAKTPTRAGFFEVLPSKPSLFLSEITDGPALGDGRPLTLTPDDGKALDRLMRRMQRRADFPAFLNNVTEISRKADAEADYSATQLSEAILKDFALTAKLLRMVNGLFANRFGGKVFSVNQAVLILGFDRVRSMALGVSVYKGSQSASGDAAPMRAGRFHEELADEAINSLVSGEIARVLAYRAGIKDTELAMMCAMFRNLGQQLVMEYLPEEYQKILALCEQQNLTRPVAAQRVLGTTLQKIGIGVAERWSLPKLISLAMSSNPRPDAPLAREEDRLAALAKLSNDLCYLVATEQRQNYKAALQRLLAMNKRLLVLHDQELTGLLGTVCKSFETRYSALFGPYHKKSRFLFNARTLTGEAPPPVRREPKPLSAGEIATLGGSVERLEEGLARRQPPDPLLSDALQTLASILDAPRVLLLTQTADRKELEVRAAFGEETKALRAHLKLPLSHPADIFTSALRSGKNVIIGDALGPATMRRLPQRYFEAIGSVAFALYVCASRGYPTALLLVDAQSAEHLPAKERVSASKALRELIAKIAERK